MQAAALYSEEFRLHSPEPYDHPENPGRLDWALRGVRAAGWRLVEPPRGDRRLFLRVHSEDYYRRVELAASSGTVEWLDPDTYVSPGTLRSLDRLAGAVEEAVRIAVRGEGPVLVLGRPPGHHAGRRGLGLGAPTLGFCIFNASALAAVLLGEHGRTAVIDFDVHHGNGTQDILWEDPVMHVDLHQDPATIYPGTGFPHQIGGGSAPKANICLPPGSGDDVYSDAAGLAAELLKGYEPDYIVVSAGFDAYQGDTPFASMRATSNTFHLLGRLLRPWAPRTVVVLEGGYSLGLERGLAAFLSGLTGHPDPVGDEPTSTPRRGWEWYERRKRELLEALGTP